MLKVDDRVRVALDSKRQFLGQRTGTIEYAGDTWVRVRFDTDDEFTYWYRRSDLVAVPSPSNAPESPDGST